MKRKKMLRAFAVQCALLLGVQAALVGCKKQTGSKENETTTEAKSEIPGDDDDVYDIVWNKDYTVDNLDTYVVPEWYRDAKFGIFIHYGVYSVPAFGDEWYGHWMYMPGTRSYGGSDIYTFHKNAYGGAEEFGYKDFIPSFLEKLKTYKENNMAEEWAKLFNQAGAKYVMPVGIHHDSYALYNSDIQTTYNSVNQAGVDYIGDLQKAVTSLGMKFGISNHFAENDWFFDDKAAAGTDVTQKDENGKLVYSELYGDGLTKSSAHVHKWYDISMEIINKYHPDLIYYDFDLVNNCFNTYDDANRYLMLANYYNQANTYNKEGVVCFNKSNAYTQAQAVLEKERSSLSSINPTPWQTDTSIGLKSWCYTTDDVYRGGDEFIGALVDIVSKNGNLLLNVGPMADGTIPDKAKDALLTIGKWLNTYGDAIYATRPWLIAGEGASSNTGDSFTYKSTDIRFTKSKNNKILYATALAKPVDDVMKITTLASDKWDSSTVKAISLINGSERENLKWNQTKEGLIIEIPKDKLDGPYSVEITFKDDVIPTLALNAFEFTKPSEYYAAKDIKKGSSTADGSYTVKNTSDGAFVKQKLDFSTVTAGTVSVDVSGESAGKITFINDDTGEELAVIDVKADGDSYRTLTAVLKNADLKGEVNVRIQFEGKIELSRYKFVGRRVVDEQIDASNFDAKKGTVQAEPTKDINGGNSLGYVGAGDYVMYSAVEFGNDCKKVILRAGAAAKKYQIYIDSISDDNLIAEGVISTGGYDKYQTIETEVKAVTGVHDVYFVFVGDAINLNWLEFSSENMKGSADEPKRDEVWKPGVKIEAELFDSKNGNVQAEPIADGTDGKNIGWVNVGDWVCYTKVDMTDAKKITGRFAGMGGNVEVRLDSNTGEKIAEFKGINTGEWSSYKEYTAELTGSISGQHSIYLVFTGSASNVDWIRLEK